MGKHQEGHASRATGTEVPAPRMIPHLTLCTSLPGCSSVSFSKSLNELVNVSFSLSSVSCFSELTEPKKGSWESLTCSQSIRFTGDNLGLQLVSEVCVCVSVTEGDVLWE